MQRDQPAFGLHILPLLLTPCSKCICGRHHKSAIIIFLYIVLFVTNDVFLLILASELQPKFPPFNIVNGRIVPADRRCRNRSYPFPVHFIFFSDYLLHTFPQFH